VTIAVTLFLLFARLIAVAFGGVYTIMPDLERIIVHEHMWLNHEQFMQAFVLGQFLPGPNMAMGSILGFWIGGGKGFLAAFAGICTVPLLLMGVAQRLYEKYRRLDCVKQTELALRPVVLGLLVASLLRIGLEQVGSNTWDVRLAALALIVVGCYLHKKKQVSSFKVIFSSGLVWLALSRMI